MGKVIQAIHIEGIQSIKKLTLPLGRVTCIIGDSDVGKSVLVRAVLAMLTNTFKTTLERYDATTIKALLAIDGTPVGVVRSGASTKYILGDKVFSKVGHDVPEEVRKFIGLQEFVFDDDLKFFLTVQTQHQGYFLIDSNGGVAARVLGKLSNLGAIYCAKRNVIAEVRKVHSAIEESCRVQEKLKVDIAKAKTVSQIADFDAISEKINRAKLLERTLSDLSVVVSFQQRVFALKDKIDMLHSLESRLSTLVDLQRVWQFNQASSVVSTCSTKNVEVSLDRLEILLGLQEAVRLVLAWNKQKEVLDEHQQKLVEVRIELDKAISDLKVCEFCGSKLGIEQKDFISNG